MVRRFVSCSKRIAFIEEVVLKVINPIFPDFWKSEAQSQRRIGPEVWKVVFRFQFLLLVGIDKEYKLFLVFLHHQSTISTQVKTHYHNVIDAVSR